MDKETGIKDRLRRKLTDCGAIAVGFARAEKVASDYLERYERWLETGHHAGMGYMSRNEAIRRDPRQLLDGAKSIISLAFGYQIDKCRDKSLPRISEYALLPDYHDWIKRRIRTSGISELLGEEYKDWRQCVDSAPIFERYWARESGIAIIGDNGAAIIPGVGNKIFLAEIITTKELEPDTRNEGECMHCGACRKICPTGAMQRDGTIDAERCLSYLTIEHKGEWLEGAQMEAMRSEAGRATLFGCDRCMSICPHNETHSTNATEEPIDGIVTLKAQDILEEETEQLGKRLRGSCLKRAGRAGLIRNALNCLEELE